LKVNRETYPGEALISSHEEQFWSKRWEDPPIDPEHLHF